MEEVTAGAIDEAVKKELTEGRVRVKTSTETGIMEVDCIIVFEMLVTLLKSTVLVVMIAELEGGVLTCGLVKVEGWE